MIQLLGEDAVPVVDEEAERMISRECFAQLLLGPVSAGMIGDVDAQDSSSTQLHKYEHVKETESGGDHHEEVTSHNSLSVIAYEGQPALTGGREFSGDSGPDTCQPCAAKLGCPVSVSAPWRCVPLPRSSSLRPFGGSTLGGLSADGPPHRPGFPLPEQTQSFTMPSDQRLGLNHNQSVAPVESPA
jgi:hypothetical protein